MSWFYDVFLASLFDRIGSGNEKWLTQKQTAICCQHMQQETITYDNRYGERYRALAYKTTWNGREVYMMYSKLNGCGTIHFGYNDAEKAKLKAKSDKEKAERKLEHIKNTFNKRPEKYRAKIAEIKESIRETQEEDLPEDLKDYGKDSEWVKRGLKYIEELKKELSLWESVAV